MGTISEKLVYLNGTKQAIKQAINEDFEVIDNNTTFREYADEISSNNAKYKDLIPKETKNATNTLDISNSAGLDKALVTQYGNTYQETTTGKNLLLYPYPQTTKTVNGITFTDNGDGSITINGTATANAPFALFANYPNQDTIPGNYIYGGLNSNVRVRVINHSGGSYHIIGNSEGTSVAIDKSTYTQGYIEVSVLSGTTANNLVVKPMVTINEDNTYEPYTNGASPNPDYPQEIQVVTGDNTINICGKNLFNKNDSNIVYNARLTATGTVLTYDADAVGYYVSDFIKVQQNTNMVNNEKLSYPMAVCLYDENKVFISRNANVDTFNTGTAQYLRIGGKTSLIDNKQLEYGSTASEYEEYKGASYPISLGDIELCKIGNYKDRIYPLNGKWYLEKKIGKVVYEGTTTIDLSIGGITHKCLYRSNYPEGKITTGTNGAYYERAKYITNASEKAENTFYENPTNYLIIGSPTDTLDTLKTKFNGGLMYYPLATPIEEEITENNYPTLYNQLNNIKLFEGVNHITMTNESGLDVEFDITYYKDWKLD